MYDYKKTKKVTEKLYYLLNKIDNCTCTINDSCINYAEIIIEQYLNYVYKFLSRKTQIKYISLLEDAIHGLFTEISKYYDYVSLEINGVKIKYIINDIDDYALIDVIQSCKFNLLNDFIYKYSSYPKSYFNVRIVLGAEL